MNPFSPIIERAGAVLFDGALATELERRGADLSSHLWSARLIDAAPEAIIDVHLDHLRAGADVVSSASYQASRLGFVKAGRTEAEADASMTKAVELSREAVRRHGGAGLVAASLGPYGAVLADGSEFTGDYPLSVDELVAFHLPRVEAVLRGGPDLVLFETLPSMAECKAVAAIASRFPATWFMASFSAKAGAVCDGSSFATVVDRLDAISNVLAVGINCTAPAHIAPLLRSATPTRVLLAAAPNSGEQWNASNRQWAGTSGPTAFSALTSSFLSAGARIIGGCCRTTPADIASARRVLDSAER